MFKAVIFDMDGVLIDSEVEYASRFCELFEKYDIAYTQSDINHLIGSSKEVANKLLDRVCAGKYTSDEIWQIWDQYLIEKPIDFLSIRVANSIEIMEYLKEKGYKIGLASATEKNRIIKHMKICGLYSYFDAITSGHECENSKPDPEVYIKTMNDLDVEPQECLIVEDSTYGLTAAKRANAGYVLGRKVSAYTIDQSNADELITDLLAIKEVLERK